MLRLVRSSRAFHTSLVRAGTQANINPVVGKKANEVDVKIEPIPRHGEETETKRARLLYQSRKRGILETDLLLSRYAKLYLKDMTREELEEYDALLDEPDWDIFYWATRNENIKPCPERWVKSPVMDKLRELAENKNREVLRMPELN